MSTATSSLNQRPRSIVPPALWMVVAGYFVALTYLLVAPEPLWFLGESSDVETSVDLNFADYVQHGFVFALGTVLLLMAARRSDSPSAFACVVFLVSYGVITEIIQHFVPKRFWTWLDTAANVVGILVGLALFAFCVQVRQRLRREGGE